MKRGCVFLFSGTGMTKYVIEKLKAEFEKQQVQIDVFPIDALLIEKIRNKDIALAHYGFMGVAYPVHSFNAPKIVVDFAKRLPGIKAMDTFIISTAGAHSSMNFSSSDLLAKILRGKGFTVFYDRQFVMPCNFIVKDDEAKVQHKIDKVNMQIPGTVSDIVNLVPHSGKRSTMSKIMAALGRLEWIGLMIPVNFFYADKDCIRCGLCVNTCPNQNITVKNEKVFFERRCLLCMRCLYMCPKHSIKPYRIYKFFSFDEWYENDELKDSYRSITSKQ